MCVVLQNFLTHPNSNTLFIDFYHHYYYYYSSLLTLPIILGIPDDFPFDKEAMLKSGIEADIVELEPEEKGRCRFCLPMYFTC
jgi:hypothetical protein